MPIAKVLLIANFPGWAFDHIAQGIKKFGNLDYTIVYEVDYRAYRGKELPKELLNFDDYDVIVLFAPWMNWSNLPLNKTICIFHEKFEIDGYNHKRYSKAFVTSDISFNYIKDKDNVIKVQAGIDLSEFYPIDKPREDTIGWVGAYSGHKEKKGYDEFYVPLSKWFKLHSHTKEDNYLPDNLYHQGMRDYYSTTRVVLCTSSWEGYPLSILEAMACGCPIISTNVGISPELLPVSQIVPRDVLEFKKTIEEVELVVPDISPWDWKIKIKEWEDVFTSY